MAFWAQTLLKKWNEPSPLRSGLSSAFQCTLGLQYLCRMFCPLNADSMQPAQCLSSLVAPPAPKHQCWPQLGSHPFGRDLKCVGTPGGTREILEFPKTTILTVEFWGVQNFQTHPFGNMIILHVIIHCSLSCFPNPPSSPAKCFECTRCATLETYEPMQLNHSATESDELQSF